MVSLFALFFEEIGSLRKKMHERLQKKSEIPVESKENDDVRLFLEGLNESDESILNQFVLTNEGKVLSEEEAKSFIAFIRNEIK